MAVAATDLPAGTVLAADDLAVARLPPEFAPAGAAAERRAAGRAGSWPAAVRAGEPLTDARLVGPGLTALLPAGQVAAPVRLADLAVAALVRTGDRVDVLATRRTPTAEVVAAGALVLPRPGPVARRPDDPAAGLLLIAVDDATAARLAAAATTATLTVSLPPPGRARRSPAGGGGVGGWTA